MARRAAAACVAVGLALALAACGSSAPADGGPQSGSRTVTIYSSLPVYGPEHARTRDMVDAIKLALDDAHGKAGTLSVSYFPLDSSTSKDGTWTSDNVLNNARTAVQDINAIAYIGDSDSAATALSLPLTNEGGILQVSPTSAYDGLTRPGGVRTGEPERFYPSGHLTFGRMVPSDHLQADALIDYMKDEGVHKLAMLGDRELTGGGIADQVTKIAAARGIQIIDKGRIDATQGDLSGHAQDIAATGADAFLFAGATDTGAARMFQAVAAATPPRMLLFAASADADASFVDALSPAIQQRMRITTPLLPLRLLPASARSFEARFDATFGRDPVPDAMLAYESTEAILTAITTAGAKGNDRSAVIKAFFAIRNRPSLLGDYSIDRYGDTSLSRFAGDRIRGSRLVLDRVIPTAP